MKVLLILGGVFFFILGIVLLIAALIASVIARNRQAAVAAHPAHPPAAPPPPPQPREFNTPAPAPAPMAVAGSSDATVVVDLRGSLLGELRGVSGPIAGQSFPIPRDGFYIGRDRGMSQLVIDDIRVSKRHVWVGVRDGAVVAIDEGSTNGTFLNERGNRITNAQLNSGDTLIISDDVARLVYQK